MSDFALGMICGPFALVALAVVILGGMQTYYAVRRGSLRRAFNLWLLRGDGFPRNVGPWTKAWIVYAKAARRPIFGAYHEMLLPCEASISGNWHRHVARTYARRMPWLPVIFAPAHLVSVAKVALQVGA